MHKKPGVVTPGFFGASGSVCLKVAGGIDIAGRVVSRVVQVLHVHVVSTEGIGGGRTDGAELLAMEALALRWWCCAAMAVPVMTSVAAAAKIRSRMIRSSVS